MTSFREVHRQNTLIRSSAPRDIVEVSVPIAEGELRKVSIFVFSSTYGSDSDYSSTDRRDPSSRESFPGFGPSEPSSGYYTLRIRDLYSSRDPSSRESIPGFGRSELSSGFHSRTFNPNSFRRSTPDIPAAPILDMVRQPVDTVGVSLIDQIKEGLRLAQEETIMVPSESFELRDTNPFFANPFSDKCWVQTWCLPVSMRDRASLGPQGILKWLTSISPRDSIRLRPTRDFFAHDVALYGGFGIEIYCAWI